jgi:hypothetical protein
MALGVIDFYSPVAKGFAAGFFCGDFGGESCNHRLHGLTRPQKGAKTSAFAKASARQAKKN